MLTYNMIVFPDVGVTGKTPPNAPATRKLIQVI